MKQQDGMSEASGHGTLEGGFLVAESHESEGSHTQVRGLSPSEWNDTALALQKKKVGTRAWEFVGLR